MAKANEDISFKTHWNRGAGNIEWDTTKGILGTGNWLSYCQRIIENHDGIISAKGTRGKGCDVQYLFSTRE